MKKFLQTSCVIGITCLVQSTLSISSLAQVNPQTNSPKPPEQKSKVDKFVFDFNNIYDYTACLDVILLAYEKRHAELENVPKNDCAERILTTFGRNIGKNNALKLVKSANLHATEGLENPLYPTLGVRRRIAINLGYVYDPDKNNPDVLQYINRK